MEKKHEHNYTPSFLTQAISFFGAWVVFECECGLYKSVPANQIEHD